MIRWRKLDVQPALVQRSAAVKLEPEPQEVLSFSTPPAWYVKPLTILTSFGLFCGLMFNGAMALWDVLDQPISEMSISGSTQYVSKEALGNKLFESIQGTDKSVSLLSADIEEIRQLVTDEPWVNNAAIKRSWPPALAINIQEQVPVAKWGNKGILNHQGDIFWPQYNDKLGHLPLLNGPSTDTARVMDQYHTLSQFFKGTDSYMLGLTLQDRGAWTLLMANQIEVVLGREQVMERLRRFLELYKGHLYRKAEQIQKVDVRYTNGVAVTWQPGVLEALNAEKLKEIDKKL